MSEGFQLAIGATVGMLLLYSISRNGNESERTARNQKNNDSEQPSWKKPTEVVKGETASENHVQVHHIHPKKEHIPEEPSWKSKETLLNGNGDIPASWKTRESSFVEALPSWKSKEHHHEEKEELSEIQHENIPAYDEDDVPSWKTKRSSTEPQTPERNGLNDIGLPNQTPSWISHREPSFVRDTQKDVSWISKRHHDKEPTPIQGKGEVNHSFQHHVEQNGGSTWMSKRDPSFSSEESLPSWASKKQPVPTVRHSTENGVHAPKVMKGRDFRSVESVNHLLSKLAVEESDAVFVYPITTGGYLGDALSVLNESGRCQVQHIETRPGAGQIVVGSASHNFRVAVLSSSKSLRLMIPSITTLASQHIPVTFHVSLSSLSDEDVSFRADHSDLGSIRDIEGIVILFSSDAQDAYEMGTVAHELSQSLLSPVFHIFDTLILNRISNYELTLRHRKNGIPKVDRKHCEKEIIKTLRSIRKAPFEYTGSENATTIVIAMGSAAKQAERYVHDHPSVGSVRVRLLRPWSSEELLRSIPSSVLRVCVLDQSQFRTLFSDVAASFASDPHRRHVQVSYAYVPPTNRGVTYSFIQRTFEELILSNNTTIVVGNKASRVKNVVSEHDHSKTICLFSSAANASVCFDAAKAAVENLNSENVRLACYTDDFASDSGGVSLIELRYGSSTSLDSVIEPSQAQIVFICDEETLNCPQIDIFGPLSEGGTLVLPYDVNLPISLKRRASSKQARIVHIKKECGPKGYSAISAAFELLNKHDFEDVLPHLLSAFRITHSHLMDWNDLNEACRKMENAFDQLVHQDSYNKTQEHRHFPRRLGDLFQTQDSIYSGGDASQYGGDENASIASPQYDSSIFGLIPRVTFSHQPRLLQHHPSNGQDLEVVLPHEIAWNVVFKDAYETDAALRPREHATYKVRLVQRKRLTPIEYDRNIFHLEFDISGTDLKYEIGDALGVFGHNDVVEVDHFISEYNRTGGSFDPDSFLAFKNTEKHEGKAELVSVRNLLIQHLDLFGRPSKKFYVWLSEHAKSRYEHLKLLHTGTDDAEGFKLGVSETLTYADILLQHPSARPSVEMLASVIPPIKARHYSIASSMRYSPRSVSLLIVAVDWKTPTGRVRYGQCTRYLANLEVDAEDGCFVTVDVVPSVLRLPPSSDQPIVMAGLGTGMAPFRAFVQERKVQKESGEKVGPIVLYFGARHRSEEWLYGDEWDQYAKEGLVTRLGLAFSRDQKEKIYIQHRIKEDASLLKDLFMKQKGYFYLCGPTWPVPDVRDAMAWGLDPENAKNGNFDIVEELKEEGRYILEVY